jgi:hypothetical protein
MKKHARWIVALAVIAGAYWSGTFNALAADRETAGAAEARAKDPAWQPSTHEVDAIQIGDGGSPGALKNFCLNAEGNILACFVPNGTGKSSPAGNAPGIRLYSPSGKLLKTLPLEIKPTAVCVAGDGSIFVAGDGKLLKVDAAGEVLASAASPVASVPVEITPAMEEILKQSPRYSPEQLERTKVNLDRRRADVTGLAATEQDVFVAVPTPNEFTYRVYRFDHALQNPKLVVEKLRGCCGQMDIQAHGAKLWIPHNGRHAVETRDRDGKELSKFGQGGKVRAEDFGGCCEPKNMRLLANGDVLVAESGPPLCIKRFSASGRFLGVVAIVNEKSECLRVTVEMSPDGSSFYLMDTRHDAIRVFKAKS